MKLCNSRYKQRRKNERLKLVINVEISKFGIYNENEFNFYNRMNEIMVFSQATHILYMKVNKENPERNPF